MTNDERAFQQLSDIESFAARLLHEAGYRDIDAAWQARREKPRDRRKVPAWDRAGRALLILAQVGAARGAVEAGDAARALLAGLQLGLIATDAPELARMAALIRRGQRAGGASRAATYQARRLAWAAAFHAIRQRHPEFSKSAAYRTIAARFGVSPTTVRRSIQPFGC